MSGIRDLECKEQAVRSLPESQPMLDGAPLVYDPSVAGIQWTNGAAGNGRWRGARLADVLKEAGIKSTAAHVLFDGADVPGEPWPTFSARSDQKGARPEYASGV